MIVVNLVNKHNPVCYEVSIMFSMVIIKTDIHEFVIVFKIHYVALVNTFPLHIIFVVSRNRREHLLAFSTYVLGVGQNYY